MRLSKKDWDAYVTRLSKINKTASKKMANFIGTHGYDDAKLLVDYAYELTQTYGEASAALSANMYEKIAYVQKAAIKTPELAPPASYGEVAKSIYGTAKYQNDELVSGTVERLVKRQGADTIMRNAIRDGAEWAWIPSGDSCAFCQILASQGWQKASKSQLDGGHAEHIHAHCDCTFAIRFGGLDVPGYDPDEYLQRYEDADGGKWKAKMNAMRREQYAENKDEINARKRENYEQRKQLEKEKEEKNV